jgi:hypothetical protein
VVLTCYHGYLGEALYDAVYVLFVVAAAATHGRRGALAVGIASGAGVLASRLAPMANGQLPFVVRHVTDGEFFGVFFVVAGLAVAFLMQRSGEAVERREAEVREVLARRAERLEEVARERDTARYCSGTRSTPSGGVSVRNGIGDDGGRPCDD